ncbi:MAG: putative polysaccharide biosynthesis protein [Dethiobacteria bacterium]|jgi:stage V sporulation protein B
MSKSQSFVKGALILTAAGFLVRFIGAVLRIYLAAVMGKEGIGLYQMAYPIYTTLLAISSAGIPIAISKLVAENLAHRDYRGGYRVFKVSLLILTFLGGVFSLLLYFGADYFARNIANDPRAYLPLVSISPAILLVTVLSALRGYFQGQQKMVPTAISQIVEQLGRVGVVIVLVYLLLPTGLEHAAAGAAFGAVAGAFCGLLVLLYYFYREKGGYAQKMRRQAVERSFHLREVLYRIFALAVPITLGSLVTPLINMIDLSVVNLRLPAAGFTMREATALYGQLTGMASSVVQFPLILTISLAMSLVPAISEAQALKNITRVRGRIDLAMRVTLYFSIPASFGLFVLAKPTTIVLFGDAGAAYPLAMMAFGLIFLSLYTSTTGILQGLGYVIEPVKYMLLGAALKFVLSWFMTADPRLHIGGAALSTVISFMLASFLNINKVSAVTGWRLDFKELIFKPLAATTVMSLGVYYSYNVALAFLPSTLSARFVQALALTAAIALGLLIFVVALFLLGGIYARDLQAIPHLGGPLLKVARRLNLIKKEY